MRSVLAALVATSALAAATFATPAAQNPPPNEPRAAEIRRTAIFGGTVISARGNSVDISLEDVDITGGEITQEFGSPWNHSLGQARRCLLYTSPSPRDGLLSRMPSSA